MLVCRSNLEQRLSAYSPAILDAAHQRQAAVAMILKLDHGQLEMFFIKRAAHKKDPWSGQIAFPGGGKEDQDQDVFDTACRETREEVGMRLDRSMEIGRLDDQRGRNTRQNFSLVISCFIFLIPESQPVRHNNEVGESFWIPLDELFSEERKFEYYNGYPEEPYPAVRFDGGEVLWGLTYRFVQGLIRVLK